MDIVRLNVPGISSAQLASLLDRCDGERAWERVAALAAPSMAGRYPGAPGEDLAANALEAALTRAGFGPIPEQGGYHDAFAFEVCDFTRDPLLHAWWAAGDERFEHLRDYAVYVQGAAGAGRAAGRVIWLGRLDPAPTESLHGRIGVVDGTLSGADVTSSFLEYLWQVRQARDLGLAGLLRVDANVQVRKTMIHAREEPCLPAFAITPHVSARLFDSAAPEPLALGANVTMHAPLAYQRVESAGNVMGGKGDGPIGLILTAHYDHLGQLPDGRYFPGASDNASGVAVVMGAAEALSGFWASSPLRVVLLFTTGEETGLVGARRFLQRFGGSMSSHTGVVCVDEISGGDRIPLYLLKAPGWNEPLSARDDERVVGFPVRPGRLRLDGYADDVAFLERGYRRVAVLMSRDGAAGITHTLRDTAERISTQRLAAGIRALVLISLRMTAPSP